MISSQLLSGENQSCYFLDLIREAADNMVYLRMLYHGQQGDGSSVRSGVPAKALATAFLSSVHSVLHASVM